MAKRKKSRRKKKKTTRRRQTRAPRTSTALRELSAAELQRELDRRRKKVEKLQRKQKKLLDQLATIDQEIAHLGGDVVGGPVRTKRRGRPPGSKDKVRRKAPRRGSGRRPRNKMNLVDSLRILLTNKVMSVTDATQAVQDAGYRTTSPNFRTIVNQALINNPDAFKKVGRGKYTAK